EAVRAVADAAGELGRLAERRRVAAQLRGEVEVAAHLEAGQGRRGQRAPVVPLGAVVVNVERVDAGRLEARRHRRDVEERAVVLAGQQDRGGERTVGGGGGALGRPRAADAAEAGGPPVGRPGG